MVTLQLGHAPREADAVRSNPGLENRHPAVAATQLALVAGLDQIDRIRAPDAARILELRRLYPTPLPPPPRAHPSSLPPAAVARRRPRTAQARPLSARAPPPP